MDDVTLTGRVTRVELFEDRASVTREVPLPATPGRYRLRIGPMTPLVRSEALSVPERPGFRVEDMRIHRSLRPQVEVDTARAQALQERVDVLRAETERARDAARVARTRAEQLDAAAEAARAWTPRALLDEPNLQGWVDTLRQLEARAQAAWMAEHDAQRDLGLLQQERSDAEARLAEARRARSRWWGFVELQVLVEAPGTLTLRYTVPCAVWRPVHRAELRGDAVQWETGAMVWNATGEDWPGVTLVCSTARPGESPSPPRLTDDVVYSRVRQREVVVEAREETVQVAREGGRKQSAEPMGVDDGGEVRVFTAAEPVDLVSDGRPAHVPLDTWQSPAEVRWIAFPEQSSQVVLRARLSNQGRQPLLAGPVTLLREHGAVGRGQVKLVPPGEPFAMGFGSHDSLIVTRTRGHEVDRAMLTGKQTHAFDLILRASNLGEEPVEVELRERIPVSELREVTVATPQAMPRLTEGPDADGLCTWRLTLGPRTTEEIAMKVKVTAASNVQLPW
ncbi:MAG: DUF4139 domain-containing protein [Alphaproteobacteria bacterium]|nr:DUF4139 domain-containing protein [Alphaproteobacteria bacterium]